MRKNNTIYKHTFQTFIIFLLLLCMIPCLPADASPFETSVSVSDTDNDILSIETRASDIGWRYKSVDSCRLNTTILPSANKSAGGKIIYEETVTNSV